MSYIGAETPTVELVTVRPVRSHRVLRRLIKRPVAVVALCVILTFYMAGILAPWAAPHGFRETDLRNPFAGPSIEHPFGTDRLGRDQFSRIIWSAQTTVFISVAAFVGGSLVLGVSAGLLSGYAGGRIDSVIMRAGDGFASVPTILLLLLINATLRDRVVDVFREIEDVTGIEGLVSSGAPSYFLVSVAFAIFAWVGTARLIRSQTLALRESDYVLAARAAGASLWLILGRHLLPNVSPLIVVGVTAGLGAAGLAEIGLTFLGIGVQAPHPSFGVMIFEGSGLTNLRAHPQLMLVPAAVIVSLFLSFNLLGDVLTDIMSPRRR
ncbi:MAG TPA: ABC transporter permease [Dehalococcoidia bacterium]|jgi:ABC-type dipeptide/oligopeptide/nickel transport system permease subunit|nr:ABC transporter permease [Dehalococcoidia bacterium]